MKNAIASFLGATFLCGGLSYQVNLSNPNLILPLTQWFLQRDALKLAMVLMPITIGLILLTAGRRGHYFVQHTQRVSGLIASFYISASGSVAGWIYGILLSYLVQDFRLYWPTCLGIFCLSFLLAIPFFGLKRMVHSVERFNSRMFRDKRSERMAHLGGAILVLYPIFEKIFG